MTITAELARYHGYRTIMIQFKCTRCGKTHIEPVADQLERAEGNIQYYQPPEGWTNDSYQTPMLCPECTEAYIKFMYYPSLYDKKEK